MNPYDLPTARSINELREILAPTESLILDRLDSGEYSGFLRWYFAEYSILDAEYAINVIDAYQSQIKEEGSESLADYIDQRLLEIERAASNLQCARKAACTAPPSTA